MAFKKGKRHPNQGGKRNPPGGRPRKAELAAKAEKLNLWQAEIEKRERALAKRYVARAMRSDKVLLDLRKTRLPDAKQQLELSGGRIAFLTNLPEEK